MIYIHPQAEPFFITGSSRRAVLFIHGFTASPSEMYPLAVSVREKLDCTVSGVLLPGHGSHPRFLNRTTWRDWLNTVQDELEYLLNRYERVYVAGLSMGGLLAIYAGVHMPRLRGVVSINAPIIDRVWITGLTPTLYRILPYFPKLPRVRRYLQDKQRFAYDVYPLKALRSMLELRRTVKKEISQLTVPVLIIQSQEDETVAPHSLEWLAERVIHGPRETMLLAGSGHIATMGPGQEILTNKVVQFIRKYQ